MVDDFEEFKAVEGLDGEVTLVEPGWFEEMTDVLTHPGIGFLLMTIGLCGLYIEVQMPGIGIGGFVATVAFIVFFWANYMGQTAGMLELVLFLGGLTCLVLEVFIIPGFGIFGLGGGILVIISLVLASQTFVLPSNDSEVRQLRDSLLMVVGSGVGFLAVALAARRYLPESRMFSHFSLQPPGADNPQAQSEREALVNYEHLLGTQGVTTTQLTPSGKARFGGQLVDVVSSGNLIRIDTEVQVTEVHGNRVVVKAVS